MQMTTRLEQDELAVYGYVRQEATQIEMEIPEDIMNICLLWYHIKSFFFKAGNACKLDKDKTRVEYSQSNRANCCYGSIVMPSISTKDIEYKFKLKIILGGRHIAVGLDDAECQHTDADFAGQETTKNYAYYGKKGTLFSHDTGVLLENGKVYGEAFDTGDFITMCYNPCKRTLAFYKNDVNQGVIEDVYGDDGLSYRLCLLMGYCNQTCVKFLP